MASHLSLFCAISVVCAYGAVHTRDAVRSKRADDSDPLISVVDQLSQQFQQLHAQVQTIQTNVDNLKNVIGFTVRMKQFDVSGLGVHQIIKFDDVVYNAGNGYSVDTGLFTVPLPGTYVFMIQIMRHEDDDTSILVDLMRNGSFLGRAHAGYSYDESGGSGLYVVHLSQGDLISVQVARGSMFAGGVYTVFSGFRAMP